MNAVSGEGDVKASAHGHQQDSQSRLWSGAAGGTCHNCGCLGHYTRDTCCPARGARCETCEKMNHFAVKCRSKGKVGPVRGSTGGSPRVPGGKTYQVAEDIDCDVSNDEYSFGAPRASHCGTHQGRQETHSAQRDVAGSVQWSREI